MERSAIGILGFTAFAGWFVAGSCVAAWLLTAKFGVGNWAEYLFCAIIGGSGGTLVASMLLALLTFVSRAARRRRAPADGA